MVRAKLEKLDIKQLRKYISEHNKVVRKYIGEEIKQARVEYNKELKVRRREMRAARTLSTKGKKKPELIDMIMNEPLLVKRLKSELRVPFENLEKKREFVRKVKEERKSKQSKPKPQIPKITITEAEEPTGGAPAEPKSRLGPIPKSNVRIRVGPDKRKKSGVVTFNKDLIDIEKKGRKKEVVYDDGENNIYIELTLQGKKDLLIEFQYSQFDKSKPRAPKGSTRKLLCLLINHLIEKNMLSDKAMVSLVAGDIEGTTEQKHDISKLKKMYEKMGFEQTADFPDSAFYVMPIKKFFEWCQKTYTDEFFILSEKKKPKKITEPKKEEIGEALMPIDMVIGDIIKDLVNQRNISNNLERIKSIKSGYYQSESKGVLSPNMTLEKFRGGSFRIVAQSNDLINEYLFDEKGNLIDRKQTFKEKPKKEQAKQAEKKKPKAKQPEPEPETTDEEEEPEPYDRSKVRVIAGIGRKLKEDWLDYMEYRTGGEPYTEADQKFELEQFQKAEVDFFKARARRTDPNNSASKQAKAAATQARIRDDIKEEINELGEGVKRLYQKLTPQLFRAFEDKKPSSEAAIKKILEK